MNQPVSFLVAVPLLVIAAACSSTTNGTGSGSSSSGGGAPDRTVKQGSETAPDESGTPSNPQPTGKSCVSSSDCAYYYCKCNDSAVVNSRLCAQGSCQGPDAHCESACNTFGHSGWSRMYGGGDSTSSQDGGTSEDSCTSKEECPAFQCGCTDGSRIQVRDCYGGQCQDALTGCQSACEDSGRGDWDGS